MTSFARASFALVVLTGCHSAASPPVETSPAPLATRRSDAPLVDAADAAPAAASESPAEGPFVRAPGNSGALAIDDEWLYFVDGAHGLARASKRDGRTMQSIRPAPAPSKCCALVAVDRSDVYWSFDAEVSTGLWKTPKNVESGATKDAATAVDASHPACLAVDADAIYSLRLTDANVWARGGTVVRLAKGGGPAKVLAKIESPGFGCIVVDETNVYFAALNERTGESAVRAIAKAGGSPRTVVAPQGIALHMQVDATHVYWADGGMLARARKSGGPREKVASPDGCLGVTAIALDETDVYFACGGAGPARDTGAVWRIAKNSKTGKAAPELIVARQLVPQAIVTDNDYVYWSYRDSEGRPAGEGGIGRVAKR